MQASSILEPRLSRQAAIARAEALAELAFAAVRGLGRVARSIGRNARRATLRRDLHAMSDHMLRDIGVDRTQIDSLFR